jgi:uncharacterized protein (TIGR04255 family)
MDVKRYRKPPLTERVVSLGFSMDEENFQTKLDSWTAIMRQAFPESEIHTQWEIQVAEKNGMPYIPKDKQKITTKYQFWQRKGPQKDRCIQVWRDRISFNLLSPIGDPRSYQDLQALYAEWCPKWADHFSVRSVSGVNLEYVNILSKETVPSFCQASRINIGEILTAFCAPGPLKNLIPPFKFQFNFDASTQDFPMHVRVALTNQKTEEISLRLLFRAATEKPGREVSLDAIPLEMDTAHSIILAEFDAFFTEKAKTSFEPV